MKGFLLAVDPGIRASGCALFYDDKLVACALVENPATKGNRAHEAASMAAAITQWASRRMPDKFSIVAAVALEWQQVYKGEGNTVGRKGDPNDLLALTAICGALVPAFYPAAVTSYIPAEWKGQMSKGACEMRVKSRLDTPEITVVNKCGCRPAKMHNVYDAIGIGLHHLGRFERKRVIPC